jgi:hypothetical protein
LVVPPTHGDLSLIFVYVDVACPCKFLLFVLCCSSFNGDGRSLPPASIRALSIHLISLMVSYEVEFHTVQVSDKMVCYHQA